MNFDFSADQLAIRDAVESICADFGADYWLARDRDGRWPSEFCDAVASYVGERDLAALRVDRMRWDATLRNLELIGEAASHVPVELRTLAPEVAWRQMIGARNRLARA